MTINTETHAISPCCLFQRSLWKRRQEDSQTQKYLKFSVKHHCWHVLICISNSTYRHCILNTLFPVRVLFRGVKRYGVACQSISLREALRLYSLNLSSGHSGLCLWVNMWSPSSLFQSPCLPTKIDFHCSPTAKINSIFLMSHFL